MLSIMAIWFRIINAARQITEEFAIYRRERAGELEGSVPYVSSKILVLTLLVLIQSLILLLLIGLKVQLRAIGTLLPGRSSCL